MSVGGGGPPESNFKDGLLKADNTDVQTYELLTEILNELKKLNIQMATITGDEL